MKKMIYPSVVLFVLLGFSCAWADATVETFIKFGGFNGSGAYEGTTVTRIQGDKQAETSSIKFSGVVLSWAAGKSETTTITRIDKGVIWTLDTNKKTYVETPLADFGLNDLDDGEDMSAGDEIDEDDKPRVKVTRSEFQVKKTGAKQSINGFACEEYLMTWLVELEDLETKEKTANTMKTSLWTTPETPAIKKLQAEQGAFSQTYMKKLGVNISPEEMQLFGMAAFAMASGASDEELAKEFEKFKKEMTTVKGYPIRTAVDWSMAGDRPAAPQPEEEPGGISFPAGKDDLLGGLGGMVSKAVSKKVSDSTRPDANAPFFSSMTEVKAISIDALPAGTFDLPSGYKRQQ